jgi:hypothetical protein
MISISKRFSSSRGNAQRGFNPMKNWLTRNHNSFLKKQINKSQLEITPTKINQVIAAEASTDLC